MVFRSSVPSFPAPVLSIRVRRVFCLRAHVCLVLPLLALLAVPLFPNSLLGQKGPVIPRRDFQIWMSFDAAHPLSERVDFLLSTGIRYSNDLGHLSYRRITTGFAFRWHKYFTFEPFYQYSVSDSIFGPLTPENRLGFATTVGAPWKRWWISDRNRGEWRFRENRRSWRYRNRVEFRRPMVIVHKELSVFAWNEVYYSSLAGRWYRNRLALGAGRRVGKRVSIDVFYVHQNDGFSRPGDLNGLGMTIRTLF